MCVCVHIVRCLLLAVMLIPSNVFLVSLISVQIQITMIVNRDLKKKIRKKKDVQDDNAKKKKRCKTGEKIKREAKRKTIGDLTKTFCVE